MKRLLTGILACLLLCGCGAQESEITEPTLAQEAVTATEPPGSYLAGSEIEAATTGAVRAYEPNLGEIYGLFAAGDDLLVFTGKETTTITRLTGENLFRVAEVQLDSWLLPETVYLSENWVIYFDQAANALIYLDENLTEFHRVTLPEDLEGYPILTEDRKQLYYCTPSGVRCMDMESGISRLIKEMTFDIQSIADILLDGSVLAVCVTDGVSNTETLYLDAQTGALVYALREDMQLKSNGEYYYAIDTEGLVDQMLFGRAGEEPTQLTPENYLDSGVFLETTHAAVVYTANGLDYYNLATGCRTAALPLEENPVTDLTTSGNGYLYFRNGGTIYRWNLAATPTADEAVYTGTRYTLEVPDESGMAACKLRAQQLGEKYGLEIKLGIDAADVMPWDYGLVVEYQVPVIEDTLDQLEGVLSAFPAGFFETAMAGFADSRVSLCLVRGLVGSYESGSLETADGIQFWQDDQAYVALAMGETFTQTFYHEMFHVLESRVLSETIHYYRWDELNPKGFAYDNDYIANQSRDGSAYLEEKTRSFIDTYSMSFATEDRARVFEYACMPDNENYFISYTMQQKLKTLCKGIREAYGLDATAEIFLWEQYLEMPLVS